MEGEGIIMKKLRNSALKEIMNSKVNNAELDVLMYVIRYSDATGLAKGIYYKDICSTLKICNQTYYDAVRGLEKKKLITVKKQSFYDNDLCVLVNDCTDINEVKHDGYVSLNLKILDREEFIELKANEKILAMHFLMRLQGGRRIVKVVSKKFLQDWSDRFGVVKYTVQKYLFNLKSFFNIKKQEKFYIIGSKENTFLRETKKNSENQLIGEQVVKAECRRRAIKIETKKHLQDVAYVVQIQYKGILDFMKKEKLLPNPVGDLLDLYKKETGEKKLIPSLLHKLFLSLKTKFVENLHNEMMERVKNPVDIFQVDDYEFNFV